MTMMMQTAIVCALNQCACGPKKWKYTRTATWAENVCHLQFVSISNKKISHHNMDHFRPGRE